MLSHIYIKNFAIIREIDVELSGSLNIISGETGTGKSIVIQAVNMALGSRGSSSLVADGADKALVQLVFQLDPADKAFISSHMEGFDDDELIITRELHKNGRSIARLNGEIVNLSTLGAVAKRLADIHGQYDNQTLLDPESHIDFVDKYSPEKIKPLKESLSKAYRRYSRLKSEIAKLRNSRAEYLRRQDFIKYELDEINAADVKPEEDDELSRRASMLQNSERIYAALNECCEILDNLRLKRCEALMREISSYDPLYSDIAASLSDCVYTLDDITEDIRKERDGMSFSPEELDSVMIRLSQLDNLKRKYGGSLESVIAHRDKCAAEFRHSEDSEETEKKLKSEFDAARNELLALSKELSLLRKAAAEKLAERMTSELSELNFPNAVFAARCETARNSSGSVTLTENGIDKIEFLFSANKGQALRPMADIASGGEISRISLAFKRITGDSGGTGTMIFDEIDTGISGRTASVVGSKLREIARNHQIICITHLPQIAAAGDYHYLISKDADEDSSYTTIRLLSHEERVSEIARLLGGTTVTDTTLKSAEELIAGAKSTQPLQAGRLT